MQLLQYPEEKRIRQILDDTASKYNLFPSHKEVFLADGMSIDRLWTIRLGVFQTINVVGFEIEKGIPSNERLRKDIMNIAYSKAPLGYVIIPHSRIMKIEYNEDRSGWATWYKNSLYKDFQSYRGVFPNLNISLVDADAIIKNESAIRNAEKWIPILEEADFKGSS
jgi:hypothetical protein